jgi:hypothetical protein
MYIGQTKNTNTRHTCCLCLKKKYSDQLTFFWFYSYTSPTNSTRTMHYACSDISTNYDPFMNCYKYLRTVKYDTMIEFPKT